MAPLNQLEGRCPRRKHSETQGNGCSPEIRSKKPKGRTIVKQGFLFGTFTAGLSIRYEKYRVTNERMAQGGLCLGELTRSFVPAGEQVHRIWQVCSVLLSAEAMNKPLPAEHWGFRRLRAAQLACTQPRSRGLTPYLSETPKKTFENNRPSLSTPHPCGSGFIGLRVSLGGWECRSSPCPGDSHAQQDVRNTDGHVVT